MADMKTYEIDRKEASRLLKISTRSIDRYIRNGKIPAKRVLGRVFLSREDVFKIKQGETFNSSLAENQNRQRPISNIQHQHVLQPPANDYRELYESSLRAINEKNMKLEQTQYRIGQLESQLGSVFPMKLLSDQKPPDHQTEKLMLQNYEEKLRKEKLNRNILASIVYILLILQPILWYFLRQT